eukprot:SAG31_NODE_2_length_46263_cov_45.908043_35_plen_137_part_00
MTRVRWVRPVHNEIFVLEYARRLVDRSLGACEGRNRGFKYRRDRAPREPSIVDLARVRRRTRGPYAQTLLRYSKYQNSLITDVVNNPIHMKTGIKCFQLGSFRRYLPEVSVSGARRKFELTKFSSLAALPAGAERP